MKFPRATIVLLLTLLVSSLAAEEDADNKQAAAPVFEKDILPILQAKCGSCHFGEKPKAGLDLSRRATIIRGGQTGPALRISAAETSLLFEVLSSDRMPLQGPKLTADEKGLIRTWINEGALSDAKGEIEANQSGIAYDESEYDYWSFYPPTRPAIPDVSQPQLISNAIDAFLLAKLEAQQLTYSDQASRQTLIRRVYYDLTGLPPAPHEVARFVSDSAPDAYSQLVDRVLASPHYGERWGRHWLDVAGYSDSAGVLSADQDRQLIWRYRDYVIRALNSDMPYDQFVQQQLAGDEMSAYWDHYKQDDRLPDDVVEALTATGFLRTGPDASRPDFNTIKNVNGLYYYPTIDSQLAIVTSGLMGITIKCAKCHNHKFDPIPQENYYQLQSILMTVYNPANWVPFRDRRRPIASEKQVTLAEARNKEVDANVAALKKEMAEYRQGRADELYKLRLTALPAQIREDIAAAIGVAAEKRSPVQKYLADKFATHLRPPDDTLDAELSASFADFTQTLADKNAAVAAEQRRKMFFDYVYAAYDVEGEPFTPLLLRGDAQTPGPLVRPGVPEMIKAEQPFEWEPPAEGAVTSGRRLALARWLTQPRHPLTSRVIVNRLWLHHFGEGLVATVEDLGWAGENPIHQSLLDWLALELESHDWSLKYLHRLILTSTAYRQLAINEGPLADQAEQLDPQNRLLWRQNLRRLEAEPLRDSILSVAGGLNSRMYGYPDAIATRPDGEVVVNDDKLPQKRAIYIRNKRSAPVSMLQLFDQPDIETNCARRSQSTVPLQALSMMNSDLVSNAAVAFADRVRAEGGDDPIDFAFAAAFSRNPTADEKQILTEFLQAQIAIHEKSSGDRRAWAYGYGTIDSQDARQVAFTHFPHFEKGQWQLGAGYPFMGSFWAGIKNDGGHPGVGKPVILRWTAAQAGTIKLEGVVHHPSPGGNGVRTTVTTSRLGQRGQWQVAHKRQQVAVEAFEVQQGDLVYIVTDMNGELTSDNFLWSFRIQQVDKDGRLLRSWDSSGGFHGPISDSPADASASFKRALIDLCHVLLASNEFAYVD
jgi:hypothetical protein